MLNIKALLTKILKRVNYRIVTVSTQAVTLAASTSQWVTVPLPTSGKAIAVAGYYISGSGNINITIYNYRLRSTGASFALRNQSTTAQANISLDVDYLVVD